MNYADLKQAIRDTTEVVGEPTFESRLDMFIQNTERNVYQTVHLPALRKNSSANLTANNKYLTMPGDFLAPDALAITVSGSQQYALIKDVEFMREAFPNPSTTGVPTHYALFDSSAFILGPTPDQAYTVELHYFAYPTSIVTAGTTWLGDNYSNILLYGSVVEAYTFLKGDPDILSNYMHMFNAAIQALQGLGEGKDRMDKYRYPQINRKQT